MHPIFKNLATTGEEPEMLLREFTGSRELSQGDGLKWVFHAKLSPWSCFELELVSKEKGLNYHGLLYPKYDT